MIAYSYICVQVFSLLLGSISAHILSSLLLFQTLHIVCIFKELNVSFSYSMKLGRQQKTCFFHFGDTRAISFLFRLFLVCWWIGRRAGADAAQVDREG